MSMDSNNAVMNSPMGGEIGFREAPYRSQDMGSSPPIMDASRSAGMTPQIMVLLLTHAIKRCWKWALFAGLILSSIAAGVTYVAYPLNYESTSWIYVSQAIPYTIFKQDAARDEYQNYLNSQFTLIKTSVILGEVLKDNRVVQNETLLKVKDREAYLHRNVRVAQKGKSEYFTISYTDKKPADAQAVVDAVTKSYMAYQNKISASDNVDIRKRLIDERRRYESQVNQRRSAIIGAMKDAANKGVEVVGGLPGGTVAVVQDSILKELQMTQARLASLKAQLTVAEKDFEDAKNGRLDDDNNPHKIPPILLEDAIRNDPLLLSYETNINQKNAEYESRAAKFKDGDPQLKRMKDELDTLKKEKETYEKSLQATKQVSLAQGIQMEIQKDIWNKRAEIRSLEGYVEELEKKVGEQKVASEDRAVDTANIDFQKEELTRETRILNMFYERLAALDTENRSPSRVRDFIPANLPLEPKSATRIPLMIMVAAGVFLAPFFLGVVIEMSKPRLYHVSQVRKAVPNIIIGEIMEPPVSWLRGNAFRRRLARYRESVHNWCTHLLLADPFRRCQTLAVASVSEDDGKTFLAIQIASAMAQMKSGPVLLIDGDMRVGRLHLLFGNEESGPGLADVLAFRTGTGQAVVLNEREPNLHLLSAGHLDMSPYELLGDGRFRELLDVLSTHYALILVVIPPIAHAAESLMMAASVDSVILCVRQGSTVLAAMEDAFRKLVNTGSNVDGVVVKDIPYSQMAGRDGGFSDKVEQIRLSHLLKHTDAY